MNLKRTNVKCATVQFFHRGKPNLKVARQPEHHIFTGKPIMISNIKDKDDNPLGYPDRLDPHLSHQQADQVLINNQDQGLEKFIDALQMKTPVSKLAALTLMEALVKDTTTSYAEDIANTMRSLNWNDLLGSGENLMDVARRAVDFFNTHPGLEIYNSFVKTLSKTNDTMY
ncbi:hypothetical protein [Polaromonas sp. UBA4122]|uniref:hypothetical protein n=1 Tax=Polaromonas sp. UBA4122 TaxID=1947074 RepID=UPI0025DB0D49|nr:hypothetical protein [Polaromonas sp. UBA4122]